MQGEVVIAVAGNKLDFRRIAGLMKMECTSCIRKGDAITPFKVSKKDRWIHVIPIHDDDEVDNKLRDITGHLVSNTDYSHIIDSDEATLSVNIYYRTETDQFGFLFSKETLSNLSALNVPLGIHIIAY